LGENGSAITNRKSTIMVCEDDTPTLQLIQLTSLSIISLILLCASFQSTSALYYGNDRIILEGENLESYSAPKQVAVTDSGYVYVVWVDKDTVYLKASYDYGTQFGLSKALSGNNSIATSPQIAATENGNVYVVWVDKDTTTGDTDISFVSTYRGENVSKIKALSTDTELSSFSPQIAATDNGSVYVVWVDKDTTTGDTDIVFRGSTNNGEKFGRQVLSRDVGPSLFSLALSPHIAAIENGNVYVVWVDKNSTSGDTDIVFRGSTINGEKFGNNVPLNSEWYNPERISTIYSPQIAATENGNVYVVWVDKDTTTGDTVAEFKHISISGNGEKFGDNVPLNNGWDIPEKISSIYSPQIAATENGNVYVVWVENRLQFKEISNNGTYFGEIVSLGNHLTPSSPQIAATENGNVCLLWIDKSSTNGNQALYFKRISHNFFERLN
jgi:hypothetical protein